MNTNELLHKASEILSSDNGLVWQSFKDEWFDDYEKEHECYSYYSYYYAWNELYLIRNVLTHEVWFTKARSPYEAYIKHSKNTTESHGLVYRGRDFSYDDFVKTMCENCMSYGNCDCIPVMQDGSAMTDFRKRCRDFDFEEDEFYLG